MCCVDVVVVVVNFFWNFLMRRRNCGPLSFRRWMRRRAHKAADVDTPGSTKQTPATYTENVRTEAAGICADAVQLHADVKLLCLHQPRRSEPVLATFVTRAITLTPLLQEVKLSATNAERDLYESLAEVYSIIITLDALEKAYLKDSIAEGDYTETCSRLLKQYKSNLQGADVANAFVDLETFKLEWEVRTV